MVAYRWTQHLSYKSAQHLNNPLQSWTLCLHLELPANGWAAEMAHINRAEESGLIRVHMNDN